MNILRRLLIGCHVKGMENSIAFATFKTTASNCLNYKDISVQAGLESFAI